MLLGAAGCPTPTPSLWDREDVDLGVDDDLNAVLGDHHLVVGARGLVLDFGGDEPRVLRPTDVTLRGIVAAGFLYAVGDGGVILGSVDQGNTWVRLDSGTTASLRAVAVAWGQDFGQIVVAVGDGVVLVRSEVTGRWNPVPPPDGGWGELLALATDGTSMFALGRHGTLWRTTDPRGGWTHESTGVTSDLLAGGWVTKRGEWESKFIFVGSDGTLLVRTTESHEPSFAVRRVPTDVDADLVALSDDYVLAADGRVYDVNPLLFEDDALILRGEAGFAARAMFHDRYVSDDGVPLLVVGAGGRAAGFDPVEPSESTTD